MRREQYNKPVASPERSPNFIMPLLRAHNIRGTVPNRESVPPDDLGNLVCESLISTGMRQENLLYGWR
jgi:hypothetical protein